MTRTFDEIRKDWMKDPVFRKDYRAYKARMDLALRLTEWMRRIPVVGQLVYVFWYSVLGEGYKSTLQPRWGAITFSFLNDGMKPTLWHAWRQIRYDQNDPYTAIYPGGAPKSLAQAEEWEAKFAAKRIAFSEGDLNYEDTAEIEADPELMARILDTGNPEKYVDLPRPTNPAYDMECGD